MRRYAVGLQLALLVCGGALSGYLWRAAVDRSGITVRYVWSGQPYEPASLQPAAPPRARLSRARVKPKHARADRTTRSTVSADVRSAAPRVAPAARPQLAAVTVVQPRATAPKDAPRLRSPSARHPVPKSKPKPKLSPPPVSPPPASPPPPPAPPPPTLPPVAPAPPAPPPPAQPLPVVQTTATSTKPGWGWGDKNHTHTGPPGHSGGNGKK